VPATALNDRMLRSLAPNTDTPDLLMPGLIARKREKGVTFWLSVMRNGRRHKQRLGAWPALSLADARTAVRVRMGAIEQGHATAPAGTFGEGLDRYISHVEATARDPGQVKWLLDRFARPSLGSVPLARLHRRDLQAVVDDVAAGRAKVEGEAMSKAGSPSTAGRVAAMLGAAINWLHQRGHIETHPCPRGLDRPASNGPRERILTDAEIKAVWKACEGREPSGRVLRLLLLTGCRREEVNGLTEGEVERDGEDHPVALLLPAERTKAGRAHRVPLSPLAAELVANAPHKGEVLFPGRDQTSPFKGWSRAVEDVQRISTTEGWTPHDLRRTCASGLARLGVRPDIIDRVLNHAPPRLRRVYDRHDYAPEMREALVKWADHVAALLA
jgi:integrase